MTDELDALKAALRAGPAPDATAKVDAIALAMKNFDSEQNARQGSADATRPSQDRPDEAGVLTGVWNMLKGFTGKQALAVTTSVAALCVALVVVDQSGPGPVVVPKTVVDAVPSTGGTVAPAPEPEATIAPAPRADATTPQAPDAGGVTAPVQNADATGTEAPTPSAADPAPAPGPLAKAPAEPAKPDVAEVAPARDQATETPMGGAKVDAEAKQKTSPTSPAQTTSNDLAAEPEADFARNEAAAPVAASPLARSRKAAPAMGIAEGYADAVLSEAPILDDTYTPPADNTEAFANAPTNPVKVTAEEPVSTFSIDVDTASYAVVRNSLNSGQLPPPEAVRIEEMVNYFPYSYAAPKADDAPFKASVTVMQTPWNAGTELVHIGLQGELPAIDDRPPLNLVFLIDTSGSMNEPSKLPLLKQSLSLLLAQLRPEDEVAIVAYAGSAGQVLKPTKAADKAAILGALDRLDAGGSTAGAEGLALAYRVAEKMGGEGQVSRILLATDGDFNVGIDDPEGLTAYIAKKRETGVYLSVLGFGRGNLDDATMQALAQNGNGTAAYIDTLQEARKTLVDQLTGALFPIANDVKIQVEWNPATVAEYRLIGYETRALRREDFNNDRVDAGEIGAGHTVTAIYEVTPVGSPALKNDPLRYGASAPAVEDQAASGQAGVGELGFLRLRYKEPGQDTSKLIESPIVEGDTKPGDDVRFGVAMAGFGQLLTGATYLGDWGWDQAIDLAVGARGDDPYGYRVEAVNLMRLAKSLAK